MSEYQLYYWTTVDRTLSAKEQAEVKKLSNHIEVTSTTAVVEYNWSSFRHNEMEVLARYFDAFYYTSSWNRRVVAFRLPVALFNPEPAQSYLDDDSVTLSTQAESYVLKIQNVTEEAEYWDEGDLEDARETLSATWRSLLNGDMSALYIGWLAGRYLEIYYELESDNDDGLEESEGDYPTPPVPAGLDPKSKTQRRLWTFFEVEPDLVAAAAESAQPQTKVTDEMLVKSLSRLSEEERLSFLERLLRGEPHLSVLLRHRLQEFVGSSATGDAPGPGFGALRERAATLQAERLERERIAQEKKLARARKEAERQRQIAMDDALQNQEEYWARISELIDIPQAKPYEEATQLLVLLRDLAVREGTTDDFGTRFAPLVERKHTSPALMRRWQEAGLF